MLSESIKNNLENYGNWGNSKKEKGKKRQKKGKKVLKLGIEPKTFALLARRSNQLSYSSSEGKQIVYYKK